MTPCGLAAIVFGACAPEHLMARVTGELPPSIRRLRRRYGGAHQSLRASCPPPATGPAGALTTHHGGHHGLSWHVWTPQ